MKVSQYQQVLLSLERNPKIRIFDVRYLPDHINGKERVEIEIEVTDVSYLEGNVENNLLDTLVPSIEPSYHQMGPGYWLRTFEEVVGNVMIDSDVFIDLDTDPLPFSCYSPDHTRITQAMTLIRQTVVMLRIDRSMYT